MNDSPTSMLEGPSRSGRAWRRLRWAVGLLALAIVVAGIGLGPQWGRQGTAAPAQLLSEPFTGTSIANPTNWVAAATLNGSATSAFPCLTASTSSSSQSLASGVLQGCSSPAIDASGSGALRLTPAQNSAAGYLLYNQALSTRDGLDITFKQAQYGGNNPSIKADGLSFFIKNGSNTSTAAGAAGDGLGYSLSCTINGSNGVAMPGIPGGLFGIGFDRYGNYSIGSASGGSWPGNPNCGGSNRPSYLGIKGADTSAGQDGTTGFQWLAGAGGAGTGASIDLTSGADSRSGRARNVRIFVDPSTASSPKIKVYFWAIGGSQPSSPTLEVAQPSQYSAASTFKFGFAASTGGANNIHEVYDLVISAAQDPTYRVTYNGNGSTGGTVPTDSGAYTSGQSATVSGNTGSLVRTGYSFAGWNTAANGSGTSYAPGATMPLSNADVTLYAQWAPVYSVTYNGNGSTGGTVPVDPTAYASGNSVTVQGNAGTLVRGGYAFEGWTTDAAGTATKYVGGNTFTISSNTTLYALWSPFSVTYDGNGSTGGTVPVDSTAYTSSATATVLGNTGSLVRTGFTFAGWATDAVGAGTVYQAGASYPLSGKNVVFYAKWAAVPAPAPPAPPAPGPAPSSAEPEPEASSAPPVPAPAPSPSASPALVIIQNQDNRSVPAGAGVAPGGALLLVGGVPSGVRVVPDRSVAPTGLDASGDGFTMRLRGLGADGRPLGLTGDGALLLESGRSAGVSGTGFRPNAPVKVFLFVPARELGTVMTDASGSFSGRLPLPADLPPGRYTLQTNGWTPNGQVRSLSLGVQARAAQSRRFATASTVVFFPELSPELTDTAKATLRGLVKGRVGRTVRTVVVGFVQGDQRTDNNKYLSTMRAVAISRYLKSLGVTGLVTTSGAGIAEQSGPAGRRASVTIRYTK